MGHVLADADSISVRQLERDPLVLLNVDEIAEAAEQACRLAGVRPTVAIRTQSVEAARSLVATGAGVAVLPDLAYRPWSLEGDRIEARDLVELIPPVDVALAWRRGAPLTPVGEQFLALTRAFRESRAPTGRAHRAASGFSDIRYLSNDLPAGSRPCFRAPIVTASVCRDGKRGGIIDAHRQSRVGANAAPFPLSRLRSPLASARARARSISSPGLDISSAATATRITTGSPNSRRRPAARST